MSRKPKQTKAEKALSKYLKSQGLSPEDIGELLDRKRLNPLLGALLYKGRYISLEPSTKEGKKRMKEMLRSAQPPLATCRGTGVSSTKYGMRRARELTKKNEGLGKSQWDNVQPMSVSPGATPRNPTEGGPLDNNSRFAKRKKNPIHLAT